MEIPQIPAQPLALLVGVELYQSKSFDGVTGATWSSLDSMNELAELAKTAGLQVSQRLIQKRESPHPKFYVGEGKLEEIKDWIDTYKYTVLVADDELTPAQNKNMETELKIKVIDRTGLILDIFAQNAKTSEAKLQVELAQLEYVLPRLTGMWTHLSRQSGGIGSRGPGEKQLEVDKRQIRHRLETIKEKLEKIKSHRLVLRQNRDNIPAVIGAIVGYTNAGKSTLLNTLTNAGVHTEDKLFATLDPNTKALTLESKETILLTDTVGFIQKLPHQLVSSFQATLEEIKESQFLLHVLDASSPKMMVYYETAQKLLKEIGADHIPQLIVLNKSDALKPTDHPASHFSEPAVLISALKGTGIQDLLFEIQQMREHLQTEMTFKLTYQQMNIVNLLHQHAQIISEKFEENMIEITAKLNTVLADKIMSLVHKS